MGNKYFENDIFFYVDKLHLGTYLHDKNNDIIIVLLYGKKIQLVYLFGVNKT